MQEMKAKKKKRKEKKKLQGIQKANRKMTDVTSYP